MKRFLLASCLFACCGFVAAEITPGPPQNYLQPVTADPTCAASQYFVVPVTTNQWRVCFNGTLSNMASSGGITALTGDVTASGSGSVAATVVGINGTNLA